MISVSPCRILDVIDNAIYLLEKAEEAGACAFTLHNQALLLVSDCYGFARVADDTFRRSFDMRAEEIEQLAHRFLLALQSRNCSEHAGCDCSALSPTPTR